MDCAECGEANRYGARFCSGCGTALARRCTSCQAELRSTAKFCDECGTPVGNAPGGTGATAPPIAPAPIATRKIVTALFADLVGSTSFGERTDPEVARVVMARYHALLQEAIDAHGGTVAKFMGDGMMATFGIPEIAEDDALRALRAGVDIQRRFTDFAAEVAAQHRETLGLRVGVNTGEVVIASGDADLVGDALNVAARIEHACRPGNVTVGEETWRLTRGEFGYESLGDVTVAGRAQAVAIFEVIAGGVADVETSAPFVGRATEMASLRRAFDAATASHAARLVTVLGSPGVGKTRLSRELCAAVAADENAITIELRCDRAGDATFAPIAQLIRDATDLGDDPDPPAAREQLGTLLADDEPDRERLVDVFAGLVGAAPSRSVEETFWGVRRLVSASARDRPMVVVIDDIQWAEPLFLDLLEHLAEWVQDVPLLLLCLARPELRDVRPSLAERNRRVEDVVALDGLDSAATEALAAGLLGTDRLPAGLVARLPTSTDGNPLFVRELVRMLVDDQIIRRNGDEWELAIDAEAVEVPPTIQSLLAARVERLPNDERIVLELASVIGAEFNLGALRELADARTPLVSLLEAMRRKELVEPTGAYWGDEPVHRFHHVLIRDAAYRRLLKTTRAELHERVAVWTDAAASGLIGEHEAVIAFHYEQAYRYRAELDRVDDHVTGLGRRAAELLSGASDRALGQDDLAAAGALARRALALLPGTDAGARAELLTTACECTLSSGDVAGARPVIEQLRTEAGDDPTLGAWASCFEAQLVGLTDPDGLVGAEAIATGAAKVMEELGDGAGEAKAHQVRAGLLARLGRVGDAELELDLALGAARRVDDRRRVTAVLGAAPLAALWGPSPVARAGGRCLDVVRLLRITTASPSVEATSMRCQAVLEALRGRFDVARSMLDASRTTLEELGLRHGLLETAYLTGVVELVAGDPAAAVTPLRDAYDGLVEMGVGIDAGRAAALLAHALVAEGRIDDAEPMTAASEQLAGQDLKTAIAWRVARAEVLAARGDVGGGIALAKEAVEIAAATDLVIDHADACAALAALHAQAGDAHAARSVRAEAKRLYDLKGATVPAERLSEPTVSAPAESRDTQTRSRAAHPPASDRPVPALGKTRTPFADNLAMTSLATLWELVVTDRVDEIGPRFADDAVILDRRRVVGADMVGRDVIMASFHAGAALGVNAAHVEPLAVRGTKLALGRLTLDFGGFENVFLIVAELDALGLACRAVLLDEDHVADALAELDASYLEGEGAASARVLRVGFRGFAAMNARDWDAYRDCYTPDFVCTDRRQIGWPTVDRDGLVATIREYTELAPDLFLLTRKVEVHGSACLWTIDASGTTPDGSVVEWVQHTIAVAEPTGISSNELFDEDDFAAALVRLDELGAAEPAETRTPVAENTAATVLARAWELTVAGRADEVGLLCAEDAVVFDGQRIIGEDLVGRDAIVANCRAVAALGAEAARVETLAVRGSRLALCRTTVSFGSFENVFLSVCELDAQGLGHHIVTFDEDALIAAIEELDARYYAGEGAHGVPFIDFPVVNLVNRRDWATLLAPAFPEFTQIDHRQLGWPTVDRQGWVATVQQYVELVPDLVMVVRKFHQRGSATLTTLDPIGTTSDGSAVAWSAHTVMSMDPDGRIRMDTFDLEDFDTALARLDELGAEAPTDLRHPRVENTAMRTGNRVIELFNANRFDDIEALLDPDFVNHDRRSTVSWGENDRQKVMEGFRASAEVGLRPSYEPLAVRGDRLALSRTFWRTEAGDEIAQLSILETDADGRWAEMITLDADALDAALEALDARFLAGEGAEHATMLDNGTRVIAALHTEDWAGLDQLGAAAPAETRRPDAVNAAARVAGRLGAMSGRWATVPDVFADDATVHDRRRLVGNEPARGREAVVALDRSFGSIGMYEATGATLAVRGDHVSLHRAAIQTKDSNELGFLFLLEVDVEGLVVSVVLLDEDDLADAIDELDARYLARPSPHGEETTPQIRALTAQDWEAFRNAMTPDITCIDHRELGFPTLDREGVVTMFRGYRDLAPEIVNIQRRTHVNGPARLLTLDIRGTTSDGSAIEWCVHVVELRDAAGLITRQETFDERDFTAALTRFDELGAEPTEPRHPRAENAASRVACRYCDSWSPDRLDELGAFIAPDIVRLDHRAIVAAPETVGHEAFGGSSRAFADVGYTTLTYEPIAVRGERFCLGINTYRNDEGFTTAYLVLAGIDADGRLNSIANFDEEALDDAVAELDARYVTGEGAPHAPMLDTGIRTLASLQAEDWTALTTLLTDDYTFVDHRQLSNPPLDREGYVAMQQLFAEQIRRRMLVRTIHPVEDAFICTFDVTGTDAGGGAFEWGFHLVSTFDGASRIAASELFDEVDLATALARLDELGSTEPADARPPTVANAASALLQPKWDMIASGRHEEFGALCTDDVVLVDRRPMVAGEIHGREALLASNRALVELGITAAEVSPLAVRGSLLALARVTVQLGDGFEINALQYVELDDRGLVCRYTFFDPNDLPEALVELDRWYAAGEGAEHADVIRVLSDGYAAMNRRTSTRGPRSIRPTPRTTTTRPSGSASSAPSSTRSTSKPGSNRCRTSC